MLSVRGLSAPITIRRDHFGVAHVLAGSEEDAFFGMGFVSTQDRLWQMEYDRRRGTGCWAQVVGPSGIAGDILARRLRLGEAAWRDVESMEPSTRAAFVAYTHGVNAYLESGRPLPPEYALAGITPKPWEPWHSVVCFKIRHVLMGQWQSKVANARLLAMVGPATFNHLHAEPPVGSVVTVPPGDRVRTLLLGASNEVEEAALSLGFMAEIEAGSNAWAVSGHRTSTGLPMLCNDSHRALDVPNTYWQVHVACPEWDATGGTFPGLPGFPHFGHNGSVAWAITHAHADYQDLYIEEFDSQGRYRTPDGWHTAERHTEDIEVRDGPSRSIEIWTTCHGSVVHGDPTTGHALALRYTATDGVCRGFEPLLPMLRAHDVHELLESQREWVDPVNNLVCADVWGNTAYLTRGKIPLRASRAGRRLPAPGWTGEHEWIGMVPFEQMPRSINPGAGFIATSNQIIVDSDAPYISYSFSDPFRAGRLVERLSALHTATPAEVAAIQADAVSLAARDLLTLIAALPPSAGDAACARSVLQDWSGEMAAGSAPALLYSCVRRALARLLFEPLVGAAAWRWLASGLSPSATVTVRHWLAHIQWEAVQRDNAEDRARLLHVLPTALADAWQDAVCLAGPDPATWRWGDHHFLSARHTLSTAFRQAAAWDPPPLPKAGDGDTLNVGSYGWKPGEFDILGVPIYRQVVNLADIAHTTSVIPGGISANPEDPHYMDQLPLWSDTQRIPMHYAPLDLDAFTRLQETLQP